MSFQQIYKSGLNSGLVKQLSIESSSHSSQEENNQIKFYQRNVKYFQKIAKGISSGLEQYILDFPIYYKLVKKVRGSMKYFIEVILDQNEVIEFEGQPIKINLFMYQLIRYAMLNDPTHQLVSEAALNSISKLLKIDSVQILDLVIKTNIKLNDQVTTFLEQLPSLVANSKTIIQKKSLLRCIAAISGVITNVCNIDFFFNFISEQLQISNPASKALIKAAAKAACQIICIYPLSNFSKQIMKDLPFDINDPELSKYCFLAIEAQCNKGLYDCFDVNQLMDFACKCQNENSIRAIHVLLVASCDLKICQQLIPFIPGFNILLQKNEKKYICCSIIDNIVKRGKIYADPFVPLINILAQLYHSDCSLKDKTYIARTLCLIILNAHLTPTHELIPICETLIEALNLDHDVVIIIIETLMNLQFFDDEFNQALQNLAESSDEVIAYCAMKTLHQVNQIISQQQEFNAL